MMGATSWIRRLHDLDRRWSIPILGPCRGDDAEDGLSTHYVGDSIPDT